MSEKSNTPSPERRVLSARMPTRPRIQDAALTLAAGVVHLRCVLVDGERTVGVRAQRDALAGVEWTVTWLNDVATDDVTRALERAFGIAPEDAASLNQLLERVIDLAAMASEARGEAGVAEVEHAVCKAFRGTGTGSSNEGDQHE